MKKYKSYHFKFLFDFASVFFIGSSVYLLVKGHENWGWFLLAAIVVNKFEISIEEKEL